MNKKYYWIYNFDQAKFYINHGLQVVDIGTGSKGDLYFKFENSEKMRELFAIWRTVSH